MVYVTVSVNLGMMLSHLIESVKMTLLICVGLVFYSCISVHGLNTEFSDGLLGMYHVTYMDTPGKKVLCCDQSGKGFSQLQIFCYRGMPQELVNIWQTASMEMSLTVNEYERYDGSSPQEVIQEFEADRSSWSIYPFAWKDKNIRLKPFNTSCVGISAGKNNFHIYLNVIRIDFWKLLVLILGISLYIMAPTLSGNPLFFYICGISFGVCTSLLVLVYLISRFIPTRPMMYTFVIGGWTVGVYLIQMLWDNLRLIAFQYQSRVLSYVAVTGMISFVVCYRMGPVTDPRSKNLIKWALQVFSLFLMYSSSEFREAALAMIILFLGYQHFPISLRMTVVSFWKKKFPPKVKYLSDEEYYLQGIQSTNEGIKELRRYCSSPDCDAWKTMRKLKNPKRFAKFMAGASHIDDSEVLNYEVHDTLLDAMTDDDDEYVDYDPRTEF